MTTLRGYLYTDVIQGGAVVVNYPAGFTPDGYDMAGALACLLSVDAALPKNSYSLSWGGSSVTVTNLSGTWKGGVSLFITVPDVQIQATEANIVGGTISGVVITDSAITGLTFSTPTLTTQAMDVTTNNLPAIRPTLDLDFANGQTIDPRITFTRASTATRTNARGLIEAVASGVPRIDFDPVTGVCKGLLIEEQRANLILQSEAFDNAAWVKLGSTVTANATTAPDGTLTADKLMPNNGVAGNAYTGVVLTAATHTVSIYAKAGEFSWMMFGSSVAGNVGVWFNLSAGSVGAQNSGYTGAITNVGGGFYRCSVTFTGTAATWNTIVFPTNADGALSIGNGTSGIFIWGAQLEVGAFPTSYIPTVASQVTRAADVASMTGANFSSWYRQDEGSFVAIASAALDSSTSLFPTHLSVNDGTLSNRIVLGQRTIDDTAIGTIVNGGATQVDFSATSSAVYGTQNNIALAYKVNDAAIARSGVLSQTDVSLTVPTVNQMNIGTNAGTSALNGHIRSLSYYPKRLTNAELQALSTQ